MTPDDAKLVEQARALTVDEEGWHELATPALVTALADAVERLDAERDGWKVANEDHFAALVAERDRLAAALREIVARIDGADQSFRWREIVALARVALAETAATLEVIRPRSCPREGAMPSFDAGWHAYEIGLERATVAVFGSWALVGYDAREAAASEADRG